MTDFGHAQNLKCPDCGTEYCDQEGCRCDCLLPKQEFNFKGETYYITEDVKDAILDIFADGLSYKEWVKAIEESLQNAGLMEKPKNNGEYFLERWQEAKKEIPPERMREAYALAVGAMAGYVPHHEIENIISCVLRNVKP